MQTISSQNFETVMDWSKTSDGKSREISLKSFLAIVTTQMQKKKEMFPHLKVCERAPCTRAGLSCPWGPGPDLGCMEPAAHALLRLHPSPSWAGRLVSLSPSHPQANTGLTHGAPQVTHLHPGPRNRGFHEIWAWYWSQLTYTGTQSYTGLCSLCARQR